MLQTMQLQEDLPLSFTRSHDSGERGPEVL